MIFHHWFLPSSFGGHEPTASSILHLFFKEALGGIAFGLVLGLFAHYLISATDDGSLEILLTLIVPTAGFMLANLLHVSGGISYGCCRDFNRELDKIHRLFLNKANAI